ncbi:hypothetical protein UFOVP71_164 [uncultured Caudovirales phage]|uniref:Uncharacterized protein n=1 Tax=uncultured Caudovirales phage TaxID=2100421 RepID=A0A6J5T9P9_9CAUD|nr:hypothetical protein UFOVP71_164 [uncultured Caudovirales phage]
MTRIKFNFESGLELNYQLLNTESAKFFADSVQLLSPQDICATSLKNGFDSELIIPERIDRLYTVANSINQLYPGQVNIVPLEPDWRTALQQMHTHFPELTNNLPAEELQVATPLLGEFNDLIHWLEKELNRKHNGSLLDRSWATICLDFNRAPLCRHVPLPESDYQYFTHELYFGNLHLHYDNVGRHPWELFGSRDYICPPDQVISQNQISPSCNMYFNDWDILRLRRQTLSLDTYTDNFNKFYYQRGGQDFFKYSLDDPRLAVGYLKIGQLVNIQEFDTVPARNLLRKQLATTVLSGWTVVQL